MPDKDTDDQAERMLEAALGGKTPHEALLEATRTDMADTEGKAEAIARNRARALKLLEALEQKGKE